MKKYEFMGKTKNSVGCTLHQIRALIDFGNVKAGDLGGGDRERKKSIPRGELLGVRRR